MGDEADRVRAAYARRDRLGLDARYDYWQPANLFIYQSRERAFIDSLRDAGLLPLTGRKVLDVGCGDGALLRELGRYGARVEDLSGIDLLEDRVERARELAPGAHLEAADARSLPFEDAFFDLTLGFTLLSSVVNPTARHQVCTEMARVTRRGGTVVVYDFWTNPTNRTVRPLRREELRSFFAGREVRFYGTTLAPPIVRALIGLPGGRLACTLLEMLPFLRTHYVAAIRI